MGDKIESLNMRLTSELKLQLTEVASAFGVKQSIVAQVAIEYMMRQIYNKEGFIDREKVEKFNLSE